MTIGWVEDDIAHFEGLNDQDVANINAILPILRHLLTVYQQEKANINKCLTVLVPIAKAVIAEQQKL